MTLHRIGELCEGEWDSDRLIQTREVSETGVPNVCSSICIISGAVGSYFNRK